MVRFIWELSWFSELIVGLLRQRTLSVACTAEFSKSWHVPVGRQCNDVLSTFITPPTSFSQSRHSIDVTWRHTLSPRCTQRQKSVTGIHWNAYYLLNKGWWRDKFVIRSVSDVLRVQSRFVKCVGGSACGLTPPPPPQILLTYFGPEVRQKQTL